MKIVKLAQSDEKQFDIIFDFESGTASIAWKDNQFGKDGAPCSDYLSALIQGADIDSMEMSNAGYSDADTSGMVPVPEDEQNDFGQWAIRKDTEEGPSEEEQQF